MRWLIRGWPGSAVGPEQVEFVVEEVAGRSFRPLSMVLRFVGQESELFQDLLVGLI